MIFDDFCSKTHTDLYVKNFTEKKFIPNFSANTAYSQTYQPTTKQTHAKT